MAKLRGLNSVDTTILKLGQGWDMVTTEPLTLRVHLTSSKSKSNLLQQSLYNEDKFILSLKFIPKNRVWSNKWFSFSSNPKMNFTEL